MLLEKWYLDAVFPDGTVWVGYHARLSFFHTMNVCWTAGQEFCPDGTRRHVSSWRPVPPPRFENGQWHWQGPDGFSARWEPLGPGLESPLSCDDHFNVRWNCVAPRAVVIPGGPHAKRRGLGYVEHLRLSGNRRHLPFRKLWWGRAHAGDSSLVWIRWGAGRELCLLLENGVPVEGAFEAIDQGGVRIRTPHGTWETRHSRPLLDRDVRESFPHWLVWLAQGLAPARERKLSGSVRFRNGGDYAGPGVWEEVTWL